MCCIVCHRGSWFFYALLAVHHMHCSVMIVYHEVGLVQALLVQWFRLENSTDYGGICECLSVFETGFKVNWLSQYELFLVAQQLWNICFFFLINLFFLPLFWCDRCSKVQGWVAVSTNTQKFLPYWGWGLTSTHRFVPSPYLLLQCSC